MAIVCLECSVQNEDFMRQCTSCGRPLPRMCPACGVVNRVSASFCSHCATRVDDEALSRARRRAMRAAGYLPKDLMDRFLAAGVESIGEQRQVTILFVDLVQSTEIIRALGSEEMGDLLDELLDGIAQAVGELGGTVAEILGDGALCLFGAPVVHEDDPERALRAALSIRRLISHLRPRRVAQREWHPQVRIGVHTGTVILRVIGQNYRLKYTPVGDVVHLAQRLQAAARPSEILLSTKTQELTASHFYFSEPRALTFKGFAGPSVLVSLLRERDTVERRPVEASEATFVGREPDFAAVWSRVDDLTVGLGGIVTIWGEAGIGKSRLLAELRRVLPPSITWLEGRALSYGQNMPYSTIGQQIRQAAGIGLDDSERSARDKLREMIFQECGVDEGRAVYVFVATALGMNLEGPEDAAVRQFTSEALQREIFRALRTLVSSTAERAPLVLVFEDLHWSDRASIAALHNLLPLVEEHPVLYILVARPDTEMSSWTLRQKIETLYPHLHVNVDLGPLSAEASSDLAMRLLKVEYLPIELREFFLEKAGGVPLFVEELTKSLLEQGILQHDGGGWRLTVSSRNLQIPDTVQGIILARLDWLDEELKRILQIAAVLGPVVVYRVLANVVGLDGQLLNRLRDLQRLGFLRQMRRQPEIEYIFRHGLIRDVAYRTLPQRNRRALHLKVGTMMEATLGERLNEYQSIIAEHFLRAEAWEKATEYLLRAGEDSIRLHAHAEARLHYGNAMDALARLPGNVDNRRRRLDTIVKQAAVSYIAEPPELNLERLSRGEALARALLASESGTDDDRLRLAWVHYWTGRINYIRGDPPQAIEYYERALTVAKEVGDARLITVASATVGQAFTTQGQWEKAKQLLSQALPILERSSEWREWCLISGYLGVAIAACGEYEQGLSVVQGGLDRAVELRGWNLIASTRILLCSAYLMNERMEALAEAAQEAVDASERSGEQVILYVGLGFRGWAEARLGNDAAALASMERSRKVGACLGQLLLADWFAVARADIALCAGQIEEAMALAEEAVDAAERPKSVFSAGMAHRVWARGLAATISPRWEEAEAHLVTSLKLLESGGARLQAAHTHLVWGGICRDRQDFSAALSHFEQALDQFAVSGLRDELRKTQASISEIVDRRMRR